MGQLTASEYDNAVKRGWSDYSHGHQKMYTMGIELISGTPAQILDVGCGIGWGFERMALMKDVVARYVGVDPDSKCFTHCHDRWARPPQVRFICDSWPLQKTMRGDPLGKFDFTFCIETIEHICEPDGPSIHKLIDFLEAIRSVTKVGMFLSTPDVEKNQHGVWVPARVREALETTGWTVTHLPWQWTDMYVCGVV